MDNRRIPFCGTPLSKSLNDRSNDEGPIAARRARLNQQQTVKDAQGRQRFHGAFTGGFSAGYYNTVDTVEGFQPRQFITHRGQNKTGRGTSSFTHSAEDYMDDEDTGEFGIAPRKIRVASKYSSIENFPKNSLFGSYPSQTKGLSVGQTILKNMVGNLDWLRELRMFSCDSNVISKSDFHGLGYKPLDSCLPSSLSRSVSSLSSSRNPLTATLEKTGKRIKISGEAFGTGILEEDEEYLNNSDLYGYDDMSNYDFKAKSSSTLSSAQRGAKKASQQDRNELNFEDPNLLAGFELAEELYTMQLQHDGLDDEEYKLPNIPADWRMPSRDVPYIPPVDETATTSQKLKLIGHQSSSAFNKKFINASEKLLESSNEIGTKAGLLHYSDLKASVAPLREEDLIVADAVKATITRVQFEWRPCSLLCKHFNVPNPYPGDSFVGTKPVDQQRVLASEEVVDDCSVSGGRDGCEGEKSVACQDSASLALRQSIFNVIFQDDVRGNVESNQLVANYFNSGTTDSEDEPQIVGDKPIAGALSVLREKKEKDERLNQDVDNNDDYDDDDQDIVIVTALRPEPEVIVLSSSSSSSRSSSSSYSRSRSRRRRRRHRSRSGGRSDRKISAGERSGDEEELQIDTYGPPLPPPPGSAPPPTSNAASDLDSHRSDVRHRSSRHKKKSKSRRKKHKRHA